MISRITAFFDSLGENTQHSTSLSHDELQIATAALLIEVATIDQRLDSVELLSLSRALASRFTLSGEELDLLIDHAKTASQEAASLYEFTQLINRHCDDKQKYVLACELWEVAYADTVLDKHEEHIIRRICDLIHLRHKDFIRAKQKARDQ